MPGGMLDLRWAVSYNEHYGPPRQLAYRLDTIVINQRLDTLPRPLPRVLKVGSLRQISAMLDIESSGRQQAQLKSAFHQNASTYIVAYLRYRGRDSTERTLNTGFTRYSVIFTGESLPDGTTADAVYLVLSEPYREVLNHAPVRPLDYTYLKTLTPTAQRFYELLSYKMFAALKHRLRYAALRYGDYCLLATQHRYVDAMQMQKQMYKVHRSHLRSGYLRQVRYDATTDDDGQPDWLLHYTPGPKAHAEYTVFMRQPGAEAAAALLPPIETAQEELAATVARKCPEPTPSPAAAVSRLPVAVVVDREAAARPGPLPEATLRTSPRAALQEETARHVDPLLEQAHALVTAFYQRFHGVTAGSPQPKDSSTRPSCWRSMARPPPTSWWTSATRRPARPRISRRPLWASSTTCPGRWQPTRHEPRRRPPGRPRLPHAAGRSATCSGARRRWRSSARPCPLRS